MFVPVKARRAEDFAGFAAGSLVSPAVDLPASESVACPPVGLFGDRAIAKTVAAIKPTARIPPAANGLLRSTPEIVTNGSGSAAAPNTRQATAKSSIRRSV